MPRSTPYLSLVTFLLVSAPLAAADNDEDFFFRKGDRIVFLGDSITEQYQYSTDIELYLTTRFPDGGMTFINAGIGGDTANGGARRFAEHVLAEKPTALTIDFGMNDGGYGPYYADRAKQYRDRTEEMLKAAQKASVRVALISPNAVEIRARPQLKTYLETQQKFYAPLKELADKYNVPFVDQYAVTRKVLEKIAADNANVHPFPDGVHTNGPGGLLMAHTILTGLKAPAVVSDVEIDASAKKTKTTGCTVEELNVTSDSISFQRKDKALPMPIQQDWQPILPYVNDLKDLNYYGLKVTGLNGGKYTLSIDGAKAGEYTAEELSKGVNLGTLGTGPLFGQGQEVFKMIREKNNIVHKRFRQVVMVPPPPYWLADVYNERKPKELKKLLEEIQTRQEAIYKKVQPAAHRFELKAVK
ncbi:MAG TPA: SGNH/GDSL hydrolase family protein [Gemmataceae bacterium]|nr:SGNH/GDSL hydrolase family protein [Gemmataceae bacterium]